MYVHTYIIIYMALLENRTRPNQPRVENVSREPSIRRRLVENHERRTLLFVQHLPAERHQQDKQWDELGTGLVFSECFEELQLSKLTCLEVKAEGNNTPLLSSPVQPDKKYRREVNSMTWLEADCVYITLHFQEEAGCDEIWEKICQVLGKDLSLEIPQDIMENPENERSDDVSDIYSYRLLEESFTVEHLEDFNTFLKTCITSPIRRETLLLHLLKNVKDYFAMLVCNIHFYKESRILTGDVLHTTLRNLLLIRSNLVLITILHKKANPTSQIESLLQELNL